MSTTNNPVYSSFGERPFGLLAWRKAYPEAWRAGRTAPKEANNPWPEGCDQWKAWNVGANSRPEHMLPD